MRMRVAAIAAAILLGCGGAKDSGGGAASQANPSTTSSSSAPPMTGAASSPGAPAASAPADAPAAPPDAGVAAAPVPLPAPAPTPPARNPPKWAGTQTFREAWTDLDGVATLPGGGLVAFGSQFLLKDGRGNRYGTVVWTDSSGSVQRKLTHTTPDDIFAMAVSASSGAIALGGYTQGGEGGYLLLLDAGGAQQWLVPLGYRGTVYGIAFAPNGDLVACGSDPDSFIGRWAPDGTLLWRQTYALGADGFAYGIAVTASGDIVAAGGRGPLFAIRTAADGTTVWTRSFDLGSSLTSGGGIAVDAKGAVLLAGPDGNDAFVMKLDPAGAISWRKTIATSGVDTANRVAVDAAGNAVVVGSYGLSSDLTGVGYVARFDPSGQRLWMTDVNWPGIEVLRGLALDAAGNAFVVGSYPADASGFHNQGFVAKISGTGEVQ